MDESAAGAEGASGVWPKEIVLNRREKVLRIDFDNGQSFSLPAEYLRVESPSAEVQGHGPDERKIVGGKRDVQISAIEPVGNYAVRLVFDDGHATGIYSWAYLYELGLNRPDRWKAYLDALSEKGLGRER